MPQLFNTPLWFNGLDLIFASVVFIIALLIAAYSWRVYNITREKRFSYFSLAFILISLSLLVQVITSSAVYFEDVRVAADTILRQAIGADREYSTLFYHAGFFLEMASLLGGLLLIYLISQKARERLKKFDELTQMALFVYLILLISFVASFKYVVFYLTGAVLLGLIVLNYYRAYLTTEKRNTYLVMSAFLMLFMSYISFILIVFLPEFYIIGQLFQLLGFMVLLYTYNKITRRN